MKGFKVIECKVCGSKNWQVDIPYSEIRLEYYCPECKEEIDIEDTIEEIKK
jgi:DNA-directed RNA polymerase subunit RPC12/RpoP